MRRFYFEAKCERLENSEKNIQYIGTKINSRQAKALRLKLITKMGEFTLFLMI